MHVYVNDLYKILKLIFLHLLTELCHIISLFTHLNICSCSIAKLAHDRKFISHQEELAAIRTIDIVLVSDCMANCVFPRPSCNAIFIENSLKYRSSSILDIGQGKTLSWMFLNICAPYYFCQILAAWIITFLFVFVSFSGIISDPWTL